MAERLVMDECKIPDLAPSTPTHSQQENGSPSHHPGEEGEGEATSHLRRGSTLWDGHSPRAESNLCRADLSQAAVLISSELLSDSAAAHSVTATSCGKPGPKHAAASGNGNYNRYYGYRFALGETEDPRLKVSTPGTAKC